MSTIAHVLAIVRQMPKFDWIEKLTAEVLIATQVACVAQALALAFGHATRMATLCERRA
ncbi:MAG: hypothetical protein F6J90_03295 [Moorea sp. SIOASIH]|uniref:hypothetical protein n=1 Tax=Moorena sp. SIOASIH TaxID=2607817 RepID=UPI0013BA2610|nr:hypothetical protein [Moorena sp. SIOASIH]NEO35383.1 hypothetical protein [Moorena sp. SIOASIH]